MRVRGGFGTGRRGALRAGRTPLFAALRRMTRIAGEAARGRGAPADELLGMAREARITRRRFLQGAGAGAAAAAAGPLLAACHGTRDLVAARRVDVAIVGGGVAGLNAAYKLKQAGLRAQVYEAAGRTGGRMYTASDLFAPGITTELGGEFVDTIHEEILALAAEFGLELYDAEAPGEAEFAESYFFGGARRTEAEVLAAFAPVAARIQADYDALGDVTFEDEAGGTALDNTSIAEYLELVGATGFLRDLLEVAYVTEYGLDADRQSSLNLIFLIGTDLSAGFQAFGDSDERLKIVGGNQRVVDELAARLEDQIEPERRLVALEPRRGGYLLTFDGPGGTAEVGADVVLLTLPFTLLREVDVRAPLPAWKRNAIANLGYGTNAKLFAGLASRPWRAEGLSGEAFSDEAFQLCWDSSRFQAGTAGVFAMYSGGAPGVRVGEGTAESQVARLLPGADRAFPGVAAAYGGKAARFHWPTHPLTKGSYACYTPGQWTTIAGAEGRRVGRLFFAGEHTSYDFQGYMNGGAQSGKDAAAEILALVGAKRRAAG